MLTYIAMLTFFVSTVLESELLQRGAKQTHVFVSSCLSLCFSLCVYFKSELLLNEPTETRVFFVDLCVYICVPLCACLLCFSFCACFCVLVFVLVFVFQSTFLSLCFSLCACLCVFQK